MQNLPINGKIYVKTFNHMANKASITLFSINVSTYLETINIKDYKRY